MPVTILDVSKNRPLGPLIHLKFPVWKLTSLYQGLSPAAGIDNICCPSGLEPAVYGTLIPDYEQIAED